MRVRTAGNRINYVGINRRAFSPASRTAVFVSHVFFVAWRISRLPFTPSFIRFLPPVGVCSLVVSQPGVPLILQSVAYNDRHIEKKFNHFVSLAWSNPPIYSRDFTHFYMLVLFFLSSVGRPLFISPFPGDLVL